MPKSPLQTLTDIANGENVPLCDIMQLGEAQGKAGELIKLAALISASSNPATSRAATAIIEKLSERLLVEPLGSINGDGKMVAAASSSANVALETTTKRISISAVGADIFISIGGAGVTAATSNNIIFAGTWKDFTCPVNSYVAAKRVGATNGTAYITEFTNP